METIKDRLTTFYKTIGITKREFERRCGFSNGYMDKLKDCPSSIRLEKILSEFPNINRVWLVTGEGEMLNDVKAEPMADQQDTLSRLISVMEKDRQLIRDMAERKDTEIDRLLSIMEADRGIYKKEKTA